MTPEDKSIERTRPGFKHRKPSEAPPELPDAIGDSDQDRVNLQFAHKLGAHDSSLVHAGEDIHNLRDEMRESFRVLRGEIERESEERRTLDNTIKELLTRSNDHEYRFRRIMTGMVACGLCGVMFIATILTLRMFGLFGVVTQ